VKKILFVLVIAFASFSAQAQFGGLFGPENYDQCILENMKGVTSDVAAGQIAFSCRKEFPAEEKTSEPLSPEELEKITLITGSWAAHGWITLVLHNANNFCVESLVYRISTEPKDTEGELIINQFKILDPFINKVIDLSFSPSFGSRALPLSVRDFTANAGYHNENAHWYHELLSGTRCPE
jgi:hypothetical protein